MRYLKQRNRKERITSRKERNKNKNTTKNKEPDRKGRKEQGGNLRIKHEHTTQIKPQNNEAHEKGIKEKRQGKGEGKREKTAVTNL